MLYKPETVLEMLVIWLAGGGKGKGSILFFYSEEEKGRYLGLMG